MRDMMLNALEEKRKKLRDEKDNENDIANGKKDMTSRILLPVTGLRLTPVYPRYLLFNTSNSKS
jgi:hypothetical protein